MPAADPTTEDQPESPGSDEPDSSPSPAHAEDGPVCIDLVLHIDEPDPPLTGWLDEFLHRVAEACNVRHAMISVAVVQDEEMAQLHEQYTGVAGTTDVLTFDHLDAGGLSAPITLEGDIVICIDEAQRQARRRGHSTREELLLYAVHGLMHLLGEDDHDEDDYQRMHRREDELLQQLGVGRLFKPDPKP